MVPHHGLDIRDPDETYSAGGFARDAREWIGAIRSRGRVPVLVGGTGFFLKALLEPMFEEPDMEPNRVEALRTYLKGLETDELSDILSVLNPVPAADLPTDRQRMTRSIEVALLTGRPLSWWHKEAEPVAGPLSALVVALEPEREGLYARINARVGQMIHEGFVDEVRGLLRAGYAPDCPGMTGAGYRELVRHLDGESSLEEATDEIRRSHRRYARRQTTWFRHQLPDDTLWIDDSLDPEATVDLILNRWKAANGGGRHQNGTEG